MLTERQQTVFDWINDDLELPVYAEAYKGAIEQLNNKSSGYITYVSHTGRDLMNGLASDAEGITRQRVQYEQLVDKFKDDWKDEWGGDRFHPPDNVPKEHLIPNEICQKVKKLVDEHKEGRRITEEKNTSFFTNFLGYPNEESIPENLSQEWRKAKQWFNGHAHLREDEFSYSRHLTKWNCIFTYFDNLLYAAAES